MKYMLLLNRTSDALPEPGTAELNRIIQEYGAAMEAMARAGVLIDCAALGARSSTTTVRVRDGETIICACRSASRALSRSVQSSKATDSPSFSRRFPVSCSARSSNSAASA